MIYESSITLICSVTPGDPQRCAEWQQAADKTRIMSITCFRSDE